MIDRYSRQVLVPGIGQEGQKKIGDSYAVVIGCGALGTVIATILVRAGVGKGKIIDQAFDIKVRAGLHCAPTAHKTLGTFPLGTVRLSPGYFNTPKEIDSTINAIAKIAGSSNIKLQKAESLQKVQG